MTIRKYKEEEIEAMREIWNEVVRADDAFPQEKELASEEASTFFASQTLTSVAIDQNKVVGLYILHPNGVGHVKGNANASYAVKGSERGRHIGKALVEDSIAQARKLGFHNLQFNAVLASNHRAIHLYEELGFLPLGTLKEGFRHDDGHYEDLKLFYIPLK